METTSKTKTVPFSLRPQRASNDNREKPMRPTFPLDAVARIFQPSHSVLTSGKGPKGWHLVFERRNAPFIDPLTGNTGGADPLTQVELTFPDLQSAIRYAKRQGLPYVVRQPSSEASTARRRMSVTRLGRAGEAFSDATLQRLGLAVLQQDYAEALEAGAREASSSSGWSSPMDIVADGTLSLDAKRSLLMNWAWTEYLGEQASNEGMPESKWPSRLHEVEKALFALENDVQSGIMPSAASGKAA